MGLRKGVEIQPSKNGTFQQPKQKKTAQDWCWSFVFGECFIGPDSCFFLLPMNWSEQQNNKPFIMFHGSYCFFQTKTL